MQHMSKETITVTSDQNFTLTMSRKEEQRERFGIRNSYPMTAASTELFQSLGTMYLVAPYLPERISTDFSISEPFRDLIGAMYLSEGRDTPIFYRTGVRTVQKGDIYIPYDESNMNRVALTYSGGKDSLWNLDWLSREFGMENVLAVHFHGMNKVSQKEEYDATIKQHQAIGFPLDILHVLNSSKNHGKNIMRAWDMLLVGVTIPLATEFHAGSVVLEGGFWPEGTPVGEPFTTYESAWKLFNNTLSSIGIPIHAFWRDCSGMRAVQDLLHNRPDWLPMVYNCFSPACYKKERQEKWERVAPTFPLYEGQCGSCAKCREVNIARIIYDPVVQSAKETDIQAYIRDTVRWAREHAIDQADVLEGSFNEHIHLAAEKYGVKK
jgi:hypothetical protein